VKRRGRNESYRKTDGEAEKREEPPQGT
jgi:hypothetical protein